MLDVKDTPRATVRLTFDGRVIKTFRGPKAEERFANEVRVLRHLEARGCPFVPRLLEADLNGLRIVTTNCGSRVQHLDEERTRELFDELLAYGVRHDDPEMRNVTYRNSDGRFCLVDFEFATILPGAKLARMQPQASAPGSQGLRWFGCTDSEVGAPQQRRRFPGPPIRCAGSAVSLLRFGEDSIATKDFVFAVSDGMGGARSGEFASRVTVDRITHLLPPAFRQAAEGFEIGFDDLYGELFAEIHDDLMHLGDSYAECHGMGATLSLFRPIECTSRTLETQPDLLQLPANDGPLMQLTHDDTHVGWLFRRGELNELWRALIPGATSSKKLSAQAINS